MHARMFSVLMGGVLTMAGMATGAKAADFVVNALPASVLIDASGDKLAVTGADGTRVSLSEVYTMPNIAAGVGAEFGQFYLDLVAGGGVLINDGFRSFMLQVIGEASWAATDSFSIGPRLGLVYFPDPEWLENDDIEFGEETGFLAGIQVAMGDKIKYVVAVDLIDVTFDIDESAPGVEVSGDDFSLGGLAIQFGVRGEF